jgi:hypothetical protein
MQLLFTRWHHFKTYFKIRILNYIIIISSKAHKLEYWVLLNNVDWLHRSCKCVIWNYLIGVPFSVVYWTFCLKTIYIFIVPRYFTIVMFYELQINELKLKEMVSSSYYICLILSTRYSIYSKSETKSVSQRMVISNNNKNVFIHVCIVTPRLPRPCPFRCFFTHWMSPIYCSHHSSESRSAAFATSMDPDQPVHPRSLIRIHVVRFQTL